MGHFIVEDGTGHSQANAYAGVAYVLGYLTDRNRQDENGWADLDLNVREANIIAATDYIENRFRDCFKGRKEFSALDQAVGVLTFTQQPIGAETITIGTTVYTFRSGAVPLAFDVLIGISIAETIANFVGAVLLTSGQEGITYGIGTTVHPDVVADSFESDQSSTHAKVGGTAGNSIVTTTTVTGATWSDTTLTGGVEVARPQPLSFPRINLVDRDGFCVVGMPDKLKQATSEYAVRSAASILQPDPDVTTGNKIIELKEKVDVIEEVTKWSEGGAIRISVPYPAADSLLQEYLRPSGLVFRG